MRWFHKCMSYQLMVVIYSKNGDLFVNFVLLKPEYSRVIFQHSVSDKRGTHTVLLPCSPKFTSNVPLNTYYQLNYLYVTY